jgi:hypothetical protein
MTRAHYRVRMFRSPIIPQHAALAASALVASLAFSGVVRAQTPPPAPTETATPNSSQSQPARAKRAQAQRALRRVVLRRTAQALKITPRELLAELRKGKSVADIAQARNTPLIDVRTAILAPVKARLDTAVQNGRITRAQADQRLSKLEKRIDLLLMRKWPAKATVSATATAIP